jgi:hypothetical protein
VDTPMIDGRLDDPRELWVEAQATVPLRKVSSVFLRLERVQSWRESSASNSAHVLLLASPRSFGPAR